jgi:hypothetical protein
MTTRIASCSCGQLTAITVNDPIRVSVCHCFACQRRTGSVFGTQARFARNCVKVVGESLKYLRAGDGGSRITFSFCPSCGATVYYEVDDMPENIAIPVGAFASPSFPMPSFSVYNECKHPWVSLPENMEQLAKS